MIAGLVRITDTAEWHAALAEERGVGATVKGLSPQA